jgi:hypothetical protein
MTRSSDGSYVLADAVIRPDGDKWIAFVAGEQVGGRHETTEAAWRAIGVFWTARHERERTEEAERLSRCE